VGVRTPSGFLLYASRILPPLIRSPSVFPECVPIELIQCLDCPRATIEPRPWRRRHRLCCPWIVCAAPPRPEAISTVQQPGLGSTPFYPVPVQQQMLCYHTPRATTCPLPLARTQQPPTQNHHTRSRSSQVYPWSGPGPMPAPVPQPTCMHSYSVQLPPLLLQQVRANSYPYVPAYLPPRYGTAPPPRYQQRPLSHIT
jgi:hypothetical protein